jgi:hypothetical protein
MISSTVFSDVLKAFMGAQMVALKILRIRGDEGMKVKKVRLNGQAEHTGH